MMRNSSVTLITSVLLVASVTLVAGGAAPKVAAQNSNQSDATITNVNYDNKITPDSSFEITVETTNSVTTVVIIRSKVFDTNISSNSGQVNDNRVEFVDASIGNSTHTVSVDIVDSEAGDTGEIIAWVDSATRKNAEDKQTSVFEIESPDSKSNDNSGQVQNNSDDSTVKDGDGHDQNNQNNSSDAGEVKLGDFNTTGVNGTNGTSGTTRQKNMDASSDEGRKVENNNNSVESNTGSKEDKKGQPSLKKEKDTESATPGFGVISFSIALVILVFASRAKKM